MINQYAGLFRFFWLLSRPLSRPLCQVALSDGFVSSFSLYLAAALHWNVDPFGKMPILTISERMHVVRVVQECITNVLKHTNATAVSLSTEHVGKNYRVQIANNGTTPPIGDDNISVGALQCRAREGGVQQGNIQQGNGQGNMRYRAAQLHGTFSLIATEDGGALATLEFPFDQSMAEIQI